MSRHARGTVGAWQKRGHVRSSVSRVDAADIEAEAKAWEAKAVRLGFCIGCGAIVDEPSGKLHDEGCIPAMPERCAKGQRS